MVRNVSIMFLMSGVQRSSFVVWLRVFLVSSIWVCFSRVQLSEPYWSMIWFRNWKTGRCVRMKGCFGLVLPYFWDMPIMATFTAPQKLPVLAIPPPYAVTVFGVTSIL